MGAAYLGRGGDALTTWLWSYGQRYVPAVEAGNIYSLEPVWALIFGCLLLAEPFGPTVARAGLPVVLAYAVYQLPDRTLSDVR